MWSSAKQKGIPMLRKTVTGGIVALIATATLMNSVSSAEEVSGDVSAVDLAFAEFERTTAEDVANGVSEAIANAEKISNFTPSELEGFKSLLASDAVLRSVSGEEILPDNVEVVQTDNVGDEDPNVISPAAWQGSDYIEGCLTNTLYGIEVLKVCTGGTYYSNVGIATSVSNPRSYVKYNSAPGLAVTTSNPRGGIEGGLAAFYGDVNLVAFPNIPWVGPISSSAGTHRVVARSFPNSVVLNVYY